MEKIDLNLDNYDLEDILSLFKLGAAYDESDLRAARKLVMRMHPDKSGLNKDYFVFFGKASMKFSGKLSFK